MAGATSGDFWELGVRTSQVLRDSFPNGLGERDTYWAFYKYNEI